MAVLSGIAVAGTSQDSGAGNWSGETARSGFFSNQDSGAPARSNVSTSGVFSPQDGGTVPPSDATYNSYSGIGDIHIESVSGLFIEDSTASWSGDTARSGEFDNQDIGTGVLIPNSYFHRVDIAIQDENGDPINDALWLMARDVFPTAASVTDSAATIELLKQTYSDFVLIVDGGNNIIRYETAGNYSLDGGNDSVTMKFNRVEDGGLEIVSGVTMGI